MLLVGPSISVLPALNSYWMTKAFKAFYNVEFYPTHLAPISWVGLLEVWKHNKKDGFALPVSDSDSGSAIYQYQGDKCRSRAWGAMIHLDNNLSFSIKDDLLSAAIHIKQLASIRAPESVIKAVYADTRGQTLYYEQHGEFPSDQRSFVSACMRHGIDAVLYSDTVY